MGYSGGNDLGADGLDRGEQDVFACEFTDDALERASGAGKNLYSALNPTIYNTELCC